MSSSTRSLDEGITDVDLPRRPDPCIFINIEQLAGEEPGLVLPTSREIQDAWEEVAGSEQELEAREHEEEEPEAEEDQRANEDAEAEEVHSTPPITYNYLQASITNDIDNLFSPNTQIQIREEYNINESVASKKRKPTRGAIAGGGTNTTRAKGKAKRGRSRKRG
jgi:hypothetical protein